MHINRRRSSLKQIDKVDKDWIDFLWYFFLLNNILRQS